MEEHHEKNERVEGHVFKAEKGLQNGEPQREDGAPNLAVRAYDHETVAQPKRRRVEGQLAP